MRPQAVSRARTALLWLIVLIVLAGSAAMVACAMLVNPADWLRFAAYWVAT